MSDIATAITTLQLMLKGAPWDVIGQSPGLPHLFMASMIVLVPTVLGVATGAFGWRQTPLARKFGINPEAPQRKTAWVERACNFERAR